MMHSSHGPTPPAPATPAAATPTATTPTPPPTDLPSCMRLIDQARDAGDLPAMARHGEILARMAPGHPITLTLQAELMRRGGEAARARAVLAGVLRQLPDFLPALLEAAEVEDALSSRTAALGLRMKAIALAENQRARGFPASIAMALDRAVAVVNAAMAESLEAALAPHEAAHGREALGRIREAVDIFVGRRPRGDRHPEWSPGLMYIPGLEPLPWYEPADFDWAAGVEQATPKVRAELLAAMGARAGFAPYVDDSGGRRRSDYWAELNRSRRWSAFHFSRHGRPVEENRRRCPATAALLDGLPLMRIPGYSPEAMFSVLEPKTRIPPHYGSVNGRLTVHLPLVVPPECGALRVRGEARAWVEGKLLVFDDAMIHEAWNDSEAVRAVLIFDVWNPQLSPAERAAFSDVLQAAQRFEAGNQAPAPA